MRKFQFFIVLLFIIFISSFAFPTHVQAQLLNGTFIQWESGSVDLNVDNIDEFVHELKTLGFDTIITRAIQVKKTAAGCGGDQSSFEWNLEVVEPNRLEALVQAAQTEGIGIYFGVLSTIDACNRQIPLNPADFYETRNRTIVLQYLNNYDNPNNPIRYVLDHYGNSSSFAGWYIADEPFLAWEDCDDACVAYYHGYNQAIKAHSSKPTTISPSFLDLAPSTYANRAILFKNATGIDIQIWQDTVHQFGTNLYPGNIHGSPTSYDYYNAVVTKLGANAVWADLELGNGVGNFFGDDAGGHYQPTSIARLNQQLHNSRTTGKRVTWLHQYQMSATAGWRLEGAERLLAAYKALYFQQGIYINPASYVWITPPNSSYPDSGNEMFDMQIGEARSKDPLQNYSSPRFTGIVGDTEIVMNLGSSKNINYVAAHMIHNAAGGAKFPNSMSAYCSQNNSTWQALGTWNLYYWVHQKDSEYVFSNPNGQRLNANCVYVKLKFDMANDGEFLFLSEIELIGSREETPSPTPSPIPSPTPGDFNNDNVVNYLDLNLLLENLNTSNASYDLTADGLVNLFDYNALLSNL